MVTSDGSEPVLVGGHPALDLVNTVSWRFDERRRRDNLSTPTALISWCQRAGLLDEKATLNLRQAAGTHDAAAQRALQSAHALRAPLTAFLEALLLGQDSGPDGNDEALVPEPVRAAVVDAIAHSDLTGAPARWQLAVQQLDDLPRLLALATLDLLQSPHLTLLRRCAGPGCGWLFLDRTRSHTRRYCSTSDCGNRDRARRHYSQSRSKKPSQ